MPNSLSATLPPAIHLPKSFLFLSLIHLSFILLPDLFALRAGCRGPSSLPESIDSRETLAAAVITQRFVACFDAECCQTPQVIGRGHDEVVLDSVGCLLCCWKRAGAADAGWSR
jgi:hypothetical protein